MGLFTGFGGWVNQNIQQHLMAESKRDKSVSRKDTNIQEPWYWDPDLDPKEKAEAKKSGQHVRSLPLVTVDPKYFDVAEVRRQVELWIVPNNKHPWYDAPAKVKVKTENGLCHLKMEFTLGWPPQGVQEFLTNPRNLSTFQAFDTGTRLDNNSTKVLKKDGPRQITDVEKTLRLELLGCTVDVPIHLIIDENHQNLTARYKKEKMKYMEVFEGNWKIEPLYVDQERLCKSRSSISQKEYQKCSRGQGRIGSKVTMEEIFKPSSLLNVPPISWFIRGITIKTTKNLLEDLRKQVIRTHKSSDV